MLRRAAASQVVMPRTREMKEENPTTRFRGGALVSIIIIIITIINIILHHHHHAHYNHNHPYLQVSCDQ